MGKIEVKLSFTALVLVMAWLDGMLCAWFLLGVICHEAGHLAALKLCRVKIVGIRMGIAGAVISTETMDRSSEIICALAGPLAGVLAAIVFLRRWPDFSLLNGLFSLGNLLPIFPLDGGRVIRAVLGDGEAGMRIARSISVVTCAALMLMACWMTIELQSGIWPIFAALVILWRAGTA